MLKEQIQEDLNSALKEKKRLEVLVLRLLSAAIFNKEKEKRYKISKEKPEAREEELEKESRLTDEEVVEVISSEIKKRKEAILEFEKGDRQDLVEKEKKELKILEKYLPEQLSEEEIKKLAKEAIAAYKVSLAPEEWERVGPKDIGKVMAKLMPKIKGRAEGNLVLKIVKDFLSSK